MNVIYLGLMFSDDSLQNAYKESRCGVQIATHTFQDNLIKGFPNNISVSVVNIPPIGSFPINYKKLFLKTKEWNCINTEIGYINIPIIKKIIQVGKVYKEIKKRLKRNKRNYLLVYTLYEPFLQAIIKLKKLDYDIHVCMIQTDAIAGRNGMEKYMSKRAVKLGNRLVEMAKKCDSFVILTKYLTEPLEIGNRPYRVIECICNEDQKTNQRKENSENICLYTGTLDKVYGICDLVDAFIKIADAQLWICGVGDAEEYVREACEKHQNIKFFGFVNTEKIYELRNKCDFLINPRRPEGTYTLYSFPSKTAEYLMSEKPVIMYKLEGIPDEYDAYINYLSADTSSGIANELESIFSIEYDILYQKAVEGRMFMLKNKQKSIQALKIIDLMTEEHS